MENYYKTLGVSEQADESQIKAAFKKLAVRYHPDKNIGDSQSEEKFKEVNEAYQTLSNSQLKAAYDLLLLNHKRRQQAERNTAGQNGQNQHQARGRRRRQPTQAPFPRQNRARYSTAEDQKKGLLWTLAILGSISIIVFIGIGINSFFNYLDAKELADREAALKIRLEQNLSADSISLLIKEIDAELAQRVGQKDSELRAFRKAVVSEVRNQAHISFNNKAYKKALSYYQIWEKYLTTDPILLNTRLALCYEYTGNYIKATDILNNMVLSEQSIVFAHTELGRIAELYLKNDTQARDCYQKACNASVNDYVAKYGNAYALYLDPQRLPQLQYEVYLAKGRVHERLGEYEDAIIACNWAVSIRPNKGQVYLVRGNAEFKNNNKPVACEDWGNALKFGVTEAQELINQNCK